MMIEMLNYIPVFAATGKNVIQISFRNILTSNCQRSWTQQKNENNKVQVSVKSLSSKLTDFFHGLNVSDMKELNRGLKES